MPCQSPPMKDRKRCRIHGGLSPGAPRGHCGAAAGKLRQDGPDAAGAAESILLSSLNIAHRQGALSWELRSAMSLARLRRDQHRRAEARDLLAPVYGRFSEGFATADVVAARHLLDDLAQA